MDSILISIKKLLGIDEYCEHFDTDVIMHINSAISILTQLGVGPSSGFFVVDNTQTWKELIGDRTDLEFVKTYVYMKVRLVFDPPQSSSVTDAMNKMISELEWRLNVAVDPIRSSEGEGIRNET